MQIRITLDDVNITSEIDFGSIDKVEVLNSGVDTLKFKSTKPMNGSFSPAVNSELKMYDDDEAGAIIFGGVVSDVSISTSGHGVVEYVVSAKDYSHLLDRKLVIERYEGQNVRAIIQDIIAKYAIDFTATTFVEGALINIEVITFDRLTISSVLTALANQLNYYWYVDYEKRIHFFPKNEEAAPFSITDVSNNYVFDSLSVDVDFSQIRNRVIVKGDEAESNERTIKLNGTGTNRGFPLAFKFSTVPTVIVSTVAKTVGIDGVDDEATVDVLWNQIQQSLNFSASEIPALATENIEVTGIPLSPLTVIVSDSPSIALYGTYEYKKEEPRLTTRVDAIAYGKAELDAYKDPIYNIKFVTNTYGLRAGQNITINSAKREVNDDFLITRVTFNMRTNGIGEWSVDASSLNDVTLVAILQYLLRTEEGNPASLQSLYNFLNIIDEITLTDAVSLSRQHIGPYYYTPVTGGHQVARWNFSRFN